MVLEKLPLSYKGAVKKSERTKPVQTVQNPPLIKQNIPSGSNPSSTDKK